MNYRGLWTAPDLKRFLTFFALFRQKKEQLFQCYEEQDGDFLGEEETLAEAGIPLTQQDLDNMTDSDSNSMDAEFA